MGKKDPRIDAYIASSADFAKPILKELRAIVHDACPQVEETMKWSMPHFVYEGILCGMASFRARATFDAFSASHRREYVDWISEAKREETRAKRIAQALEWLAEGKPRNWKYM